ncbi:MAG: hypothetical protein COT71_01940 [Candidatus Andersenbacteria bacterium CG10_big_fil_rev_8_21_14_0_10_54_11]|uniref:Uncharacterized protein n=1 Tax=Candidatus Andersenbacteria bacterium CG10_big_fil_rev_8_21_14_0_10_54_11 TaxID=1974485 RepID=A0A2M6WZM6_9BACT|nr:MAG: hypothetical protein COT71_01940 [Candidatus Andersenbacteria bacterium CG10_big_fil_rev_8_21_14_0_10_54_11]
MKRYVWSVWFLLLFPTLLFGAEPIRQTPLSFQLPRATAANLSLAMHGWNFSRSGLSGENWLRRFTDAIQAEVPTGLGNERQWDVQPFYWDTIAGDYWSTAPHKAVQRAFEVGVRLGSQIVERGYDRVHLYGYSAGGELAAMAAWQVKRLSPDTTVQLTLLDPYVPGRQGLDDGVLTDWADHYFTEDSGSGFFPYLSWTDNPLPNAFNVDISDFDPVFSFNPDTIFGVGHLEVRWQYEQTIYGNRPWNSGTFGFPLSMEALGEDWNPAAEYPKGEVVSLGGSGNAPYRFPAVIFSQTVDNPAALQVAEQSPMGVSVTPDAFTLSAGGGPAWVRFFVDTQREINSLRFTFASDGKGLAAVYWDNEPIRLLQSDMLPLDPTEYSVYLSEEAAGRHEVALRLDGADSQVRFSNVALEFLALTRTPLFLNGDYDGNGRVDQVDLDRVLLNWGRDTVDQEELDRVLLNWGRSSIGSAAVPEPPMIALALAGAAMLCALRPSVYV